MLVSAIMSQPVATIDMDDSLADIRDIFRHVRFHHLLVVEGKKERLRGMISDRDLLRELSPFVGTLSERPLDESTLHRRAHQIMARELVTVAPHVEVERALEMLVSQRLSCLPVVTDRDKVEGILTWRDFLQYCATHHCRVPEPPATPEHALGR